jgi:hypothetical protein
VKKSKLEYFFIVTFSTLFASIIMWLLTQYFFIPYLGNNEVPTPSPSETISTPILQSPLTPIPQTQENIVRIRDITVILISTDIHSIKFSIEVEYNYDGESKAVVALHGSYLSDSDLLFSFGGNSEQVIERGHGKTTFDIDISYFEKDVLFFKAYIHPFPQPEEWIPIAESETVHVEMQRILETP